MSEVSNTLVRYLSRHQDMLKSVLEGMGNDADRWLREKQELMEALRAVLDDMEGLAEPSRQEEFGPDFDSYQKARGLLIRLEADDEESNSPLGE
jgi:hypothetical protein